MPFQRLNEVLTVNSRHDTTASMLSIAYGQMPNTLNSAAKFADKKMQFNFIMRPVSFYAFWCFLNLGSILVKITCWN